jgi:hypothetical protein
MTIESWLQAAIADAETRGLPELKPILEALARSTKTLRAADFNDDASGASDPQSNLQSNPQSNPQSAIRNPQSQDVRR